MEHEIQTVIGVDVGGTNTDAVILQTNSKPPRVLSSAKSLTTKDVTSGIKSAIALAIYQRNKDRDITIQRVNIGTTHFVNAVVQRKELAKVIVIRLCGTASRQVPPFSDFPVDLATCINGGAYFVNGGYQVDGREITAVDKEEILQIVAESYRKGIFNFVICGIYCSLKNDQELLVREIIKTNFPDASITLSHEVGQVGILERENAAILNECLKPLCKRTVSGFKSALLSMKLTCPLYLTQNDGTVIDENYALNHPVCTFASGPTNSMRGAAFLSDKKDAIVVDIGGTSTDIGILRKGFPREASTEIKIGNVRTNFHMPDVYSIGLGGGSYVDAQRTPEGLKVTVGPRSAGYNITKDAFIFQNSKENCKSNLLTATDLAVAAGHVSLGNQSNVSILPRDLVDAGIMKMKSMVENAIDNVRISAQALPVILVGGGGGIILNVQKGLEGASELILPDHFDVANAVGAALSQMSGSVEYVENLAENVNEDIITQLALSKVEKNYASTNIDIVKKDIRKTLYEDARLTALNNAVRLATEKAINTGVDPASITLLDKSDTPLAYLPGNVTRINCKVVGDVETSCTSAVVISKDFVVDAHQMQAYEVGSEEQLTIEAGELVTMEIQKTPFINDKKEWILSEYDVECIGVGAGILACGGGGSSHLGKLLSKRAIREGKVIKIVNPHSFFKDRSDTDDLVVEIAYMGAPSVIAEKLVNVEAIAALQCMKDYYTSGHYDNFNLLVQDGMKVERKNGVTCVDNYTSKSQESIRTNKNLGGKKKIAGLMSFEIGGLNAMVPLINAAELDLPLLDCDGLGRAFPELQMFSPLIYGSKPCPATLADDKDRKSVTVSADTAKDMENNFRRVVVEMGCTGSFVLPPVTKEEVLKTSVMFSYSRAWRIGHAVVRARENKADPIQAVLDEVGGLHVLSGKITDVKRETTGGFNIGFVHITGIDNFSDQTMLIEFQNENLIARRRTEANVDKLEVVACVPELITIVDDDTGEPIATEMVRYGLRVSVLVLPIPDIMKTETALEVVGPKAFGYPNEVQYKMVAKYREPIPVAP